jgi:2-polyprenyl-3-methyl-5-hydroxy-6-metoxy-1,4-benzoquinol methylase
MTKYIDWSTQTDDPNNSAAKQAVREYLRDIRQVHTDVDLMDFVVREVKGKRVLDIGIAAHSIDYIERSDWRHDMIVKASSHCLGIDILEKLIDDLKVKGYNVRCVDATSDHFLGELFDVVFIGDVIEHVVNTTGLIDFAQRHLEKDGKIYISTPNPFSRKFFKNFMKQGLVVSNLDHLGWIIPVNMLELSRRAGVKLSAYHLVKKYSPLSGLIKKIAWSFRPADYSFHDYLYEITHK